MILTYVTIYLLTGAVSLLGLTLLSQFKMANNLWFRVISGGTSIVNFTDMLVDGEDLGDWLAGIIIGVLSGLFNWGKDLGYSIFSSS